MFIMEDMGSKPRRPRRAFTPEFKAEIVEVCRRGERSIGQVAKDFDLTETAVRDWVRQADIAASASCGFRRRRRCTGAAAW
jgi:transposase